MYCDCVELLLHTGGFSAALRPGAHNVQDEIHKYVAHSTLKAVKSTRVLCVRSTGPVRAATHKLVQGKIYMNDIGYYTSQWSARCSQHVWRPSTPGVDGTEAAVWRREHGLWP